MRNKTEWNSKTTLAAIALAAAALLPAAAGAQMRGGGGGGGFGPTPVAVPLDKVPVGTWAEYSVKRGTDQPDRKVKFALVGKEGGGFVVERSSDTQRGKIITRTTVEADPTKEGAVKKVVTQFGDNDPMEMPAGRMGGGPGGPGGGGPGGGGPGAGGPGGGGEGRGGPGGEGRGGRGGAGFLKPDPKKLLGKETVKLASGTYQAEHYHQDGPRGGTIDIWVAKDTGPLGVVKMEFDRPAGPDGDGGGRSTMELVAKGKGAKSEITKPVKPFDPEKMRGMFGRGPGGGGPGGPRGGGGPGGPGGPGAGAPPAAPAGAAPAAPAKK
jgi:hypothetical protein